MPLLFLCVMGGYLHFTKKSGGSAAVQSYVSSAITHITQYI